MTNVTHIAYGLVRSILVLATLALAACNAGPLLKTGSLSAGQTPQPKQTTSIDRALYVGSTSARAQKCGFYFDPASLRQSFLEAEAARGATAAVLTQTGQSYDYTAKSIAIKIPNSKAYCTKQRTTLIKSALQKTLTGNFEPPVKKASAQGSALFDFFDAAPSEEKFNPGTIFDPNLHEPGSPPEEE